LKKIYPSGVWFGGFFWGESLMKKAHFKAKSAALMLQMHISF